jgi:voltage-gated potassium channel
MTTIGYGDLAPTTDISKIFTIIYAFITIGIFVSLAAKLATGLMQNYKKH